MHKKRLRGLLGWTVVLTVVLCSGSCELDWDVTPPFALFGSMGNITKKGEIKNNQLFSYAICIQPFNSLLTDVRMNISVPQEVDVIWKRSFALPRDKELLKQEPQPWKGGRGLSWEGNIEPKKRTWLDSLLGRDKYYERQQCLQLSLRSKTDWERWSSPIKAHVELYYEGDLYTRDMEWSAKGYEDSCWRGKNADYYNRWCVKPENDK